MATVNEDFKVKNGIVVTEKATLSASTTTRAPLIIPHGTAPSAPVNGDIWTTSLGVYARINGVTVGPLGTGGGGSVTISDTAPVSPSAGDLWYQSSTSKLFVYYDSFWVQPASDSMPNPLTTTGDTIYSSSGSTPARLAIGTAGQAYVVNAGATAPQWSTLTLENLPGAFVKKSVRAATTGSNITLSAGAPNTLDGVTLLANDRILVKDQTAPAQNGIYIVQTLGTGANGTWVRSADADTIGEIASAMVAVDEGTTNGGLTFDNDTKVTDTLGTTSITWNRVVDAAYSMNIGTTAVQIGRASGALTLAGLTLTAPTFTGTITTSLTTAGYVTTTAGGVLGSVATIPNAGLTNSSVTIGSTSVSLGTTAATIAGLTLTSPTFTGTVTTPLTTAGYVTTTAGGVLGSVATIPNAGLTNSSVTIGSTAVALGATVTTFAGLTSVTSTTFVGALTGNASSATNATNTGITEDTATATAVYPTWVTANTGNLPQKTTSTKLSFVPSTGVLTATQFSGSGAGLTSIPQSAVTSLTTDLAAKAPLASPAFTGTPSLPTGTTAVTQTAGNSTTAVATTAFVTTADNLKANLASPTFTGTPAAPTAAVDTNTTQLATTAFVVAQASAANPIMDGTVAIGTSLRYARADHVHPTDTSRAPLASPTFTGTVTSPKFVASGAQTLAEYRMRNFYISTTDPGTGNDGDIWLKY